MARASKVELERRIDLAASMLANGHSGTSVVTFMTDQEGISRRQSQRCLLYTSPSPRDGLLSRMPSSA